MDLHHNHRDVHDLQPRGPTTTYTSTIYFTLPPGVPLPTETASSSSIFQVKTETAKPLPFANTNVVIVQPSSPTSSASPTTLTSIVSTSDKSTDGTSTTHEVSSSITGITAPTTALETAATSAPNPRPGLRSAEIGGAVAAVVACVFLAAFIIWRIYKRRTLPVNEDGDNVELTLGGGGGLPHSPSRCAEEKATRRAAGGQVTRFVEKVIGTYNKLETAIASKLASIRARKFKGGTRLDSPVPDKSVTWPRDVDPFRAALDKESGLSIVTTFPTALEKESGLGIVTSLPSALEKESGNLSSTGKASPLPFALDKETGGVSPSNIMTPHRTVLDEEIGVARSGSISNPRRSALIKEHEDSGANDRSDVKGRITFKRRGTGF